MKFNERLRTTRKEHGLTQIELAEKAGIAVNSVRLYESGKVVPKLDTIARIARAMGLCASDLVDTEQWGTVPMGPGKVWLSDADIQQDDREAQLIYHFRNLNDNGQSVAVERVQELAQIPAYQRPAEPTQDAPSAPDDKDPAEK